MKSKAIIIFPYSGYENNKECEFFFWWTVDKCKEIDPRPVVVICKFTEMHGNATSFLNDKRCNDLDVIKTWSVDTCQTWLSGWGHILDNYPEAERIIQIPGDIDYIYQENEFYQNLTDFIESPRSDISIGDFRTGDEYSAKSLVDTYGTYSLLANWFPEISKSIRCLPLSRPRSEFLNFKTSFLRKLLKDNRKFAYEQTLNFLIKCWDFTENKWKYNISVVPLGTLSDNKSFRKYRGAIDQIERIERMLSLLWREINEPNPTIYLSEKEFEHQYKNFSNEYDRLYQKSRGIIESARTTLRALLGV